MIVDQGWYLLLKDVITFVLTSAGLIIAGFGLATWKKQIRGTKEFEAGYGLHLALLKLRDAIKHVRNPAIWPSESYKAIQYAKSKYPDKRDEERTKESHAYVYEMRWEGIVDASTQMESHLLAAEVLWGSDILGLIRPLNKKVNELNLALKQHFDSEFRTKNHEKIFDIMYNQANHIDGDDAFGLEVKQIIDKIAAYIRSKIS